MNDDIENFIKSDDRLECVITNDGLLQISIGIDTLAFVAKEENGGVLKRVENCGGINYSTEIDNNKHFAEHIVTTILKEDEVGNSLLTKFFDEVIRKSLHNGNYGVNYKKIK